MLQVEKIYAALFALVADNAAFVTTSRTFRHWTDVPSGNQPALFQRQGDIETSQKRTYGLPKYGLYATWWVYCQYSPDEGTTPVMLLNALIETVQAALPVSIEDPVPFDRLQTLGGLVASAYISGRTIVNEGVLPNDSISIAVFPIIIETGV